MLDWSDTDSVGCLARSAKDLALYLDVVSGYHPADPDSLPAPDVRYLDALERLPAGLRLAFTWTLGYARADADVLRVCHEALTVFDSFARVEEADLSLPDMKDDWLALTAPERYAALHEVLQLHEADMGRAFVARVKAGARVTAERYGAAQRARAHLHELLARFFDRCEVLVTPTTATAAFDARGRLPDTIGGAPIEDPLEVTPFTYPFNMSGHPALSVPAGLTTARLPVGLQLIAPKHQEQLLLQLAWAYESAIPPLQWPEEIGGPDPEQVDG
jgi:aspartyl-tRNA(Asn)/glutamyl-tRNA(Gln) amidotransferase subunit A